MRYKVQFEAVLHRWVVVDTAIADQVMGVHASENAAREQAGVEEDRWVHYDPTFLGDPPLDIRTAI